MGDIGIYWCIYIVGYMELRVENKIPSFHLIFYLLFRSVLRVETNEKRKGKDTVDRFLSIWRW